MAKKDRIVVRAPEGAHIRIVHDKASRSNEPRLPRFDPKARKVTHEILALREIWLLRKLLHLHITQTITAKYGEEAFWGWISDSDWRELLSLTGQTQITVYTPLIPVGRRVLLKRTGEKRPSEMNLVVQD